MNTDQVAALYNSKPIKKEEKQLVSVPQKEEKVVKDFHPAVNDDPDPNGPEIVPYFGDIYLLNNIKTIKAKADDTPLKVAVQFSIPLNLLYKYNDMYEGDLFAEGQNIFLQPKRNKSVEKTYKARAGQSMHDISQTFGVKLAVLYEKNHLKPGEEIFAGEIVQLREERADGSPRTRTYNDVVQERNHQRPASSDKEKEVITAPVVEKQTQATEEIKTTQEEVSSPVVLSANTEKKEATLPTATYSAPKITRYEVKPGDTLYNISKRFNTTVDDLISWNHIENNTIHIGQQIIVSR
jgi:LysM repeat protein